MRDSLQKYSFLSPNGALKTMMKIGMCVSIYVTMKTSQKLTVYKDDKNVKKFTL